MLDLIKLVACELLVDSHGSFDTKGMFGIRECEFFNKNEFNNFNS